MCEARARKCVSLFAQRGAGWVCGWKHWAKCPFLVTFLGKQKSDKATGRETFVFINPIIHVKSLLFKPTGKNLSHF